MPNINKPCQKHPADKIVQSLRTVITLTPASAPGKLLRLIRKSGLVFSRVITDSSEMFGAFPDQPSSQMTFGRSRNYC